MGLSDAVTEVRLYDSCGSLPPQDIILLYHSVMISITLCGRLCTPVITVIKKRLTQSGTGMLSTIRVAEKWKA